jgi:C4-dicarboxylate transporter DctQ subunit
MSEWGEGGAPGAAPPPRGGWWLADQIAGVLGLIGLAAGAVQVIGRYLAPAHAISWAEEAIVYLVVWAVMIEAAHLVARDGHVRPDVVLRLLPPRWARLAEILNTLAALAFSAGLAVYGAEIVETAWILDERSSTDLQFPMWIYDLALPVGATLMGVGFLRRLYLLLRHPRRLALLAHKQAE